MIKEGKFGIKEATSLATVALVSKNLYTSTEAVIEQVGTAAWYTTLISCFTALILFLLIYQLMKRFPGKDIVEVNIAVLGKVAGRAASTLLAGYILYYAGSHLREFLEMIKTYILPNTSPSIILGTFTLVSVLIVSKGIENIVRVSYVCFWIILFGIFAILVLAYPYYRVDYIKPYLGYGLPRSLTVGLYRCSAYEEVIVLAIIMKSLSGLKTFKTAGIVSLILSGIIFSVSFLVNIMAFGYNMASENLSGMFQLSRIIYFNRYVQRLETVFIVIWVYSALLTVSIAFYSSVSVFSRTYNIGNYRPILLPFSFIMFTIAILPKSLTSVLETNMLIIRQYSGIPVFGLLVLTLVIAILTGKKGTASEQKE